MQETPGGIGTVYGTLLNDAAEVERLSPSFDAAPYKAPPKAPILYIKPRNTHARDGAVVRVPADPGVVRIDATIGVVIGRDATRVSEGDALAHVAGYAIVSDVTLPHDSYYRPAIRQRCRDGFCPMSDVLATTFDVAQAEIVVSVDGVEVHRRRLANLVRPLPRLLADVTDFMTLSAGDVLLVGPPDQAPLAKPGCTVRIEVPGLGALTHTVALDEEAA